jgi:hypothetical protein
MYPNATQARWPAIDNVIAPLADWWRRQATVRENLRDLAALSPEEMTHLAQDVGVTPTALHELARHAPDAAALLEKRLDGFGLSRAEVAKRSPTELRDMERLCTLCHSKKRCARDLAAAPNGRSWYRYCPNEQTLRALARSGVAR